MLNNLLASGNWAEVQEAITDLISSLWLPIVAILGALGVVFGAIILWSFWQAGGDEAKIKEAKGRVKNYVLGWVIAAAIAIATPLIVQAIVTLVSGYGII